VVLGIATVIAISWAEPLTAQAEAQGGWAERLGIDKLRFTAIGAQVGRVNPYGIEPATSISLQADYGEDLPLPDPVSDIDHDLFNFTFHFRTDGYFLVGKEGADRLHLAPDLLHLDPGNPDRCRLFQFRRINPLAGYSLRAGDRARYHGKPAGQNSHTEDSPIRAPPDGFVQSGTRHNCVSFRTN
jgi:hypothetical protein